MDIKSKAKRGRKSKGSLVTKINIVQDDNIPIIAHLPININDNFEHNNTDNSLLNEKNKEINLLKKKIQLLEKDNDDNLLYNVSEDDTKNTKCWWCRYSFTTPQVSLPEIFYKNKFKTFGVFCSYNCALSYNIDINDESISKRTSLLYYLYKKTYKKDIIINKASDWRVLQDYGGPISIDEFRNNFIMNSFEYNYIKPPFISRLYQIEKISKNKIKTNKKDDYVLKRTKPLNTSKYTLESTMGLKKTINS